ncbi:lipopolysaccharide biosynthesis protein [Clostridium perfringens]|uniref:lipopolysaccharide biosynthesis protein n=1 Tax=Clostridium perfringens TaxID=1502 RepID=UPI001C856994|nr:O-unit flippase [Clostridium perfringens]ELC8389841.1 O-unit flippase [Clostridium perfringens]
MRTKKAIINVCVSCLTYILGFLPAFIVRKIFLVKLGSELLGLSSLFSNIIGYLSLVEMGIGTAIIFSLYRPFAEGDKIKVIGYLNYYRKFYLRVAGIIFILGISILPFLKFFISDSMNMNKVKLYFILVLINTIITYLFSYKLCILNVAQEGFKIAASNSISKIIIALMQYYLLDNFPNFEIYLLIPILINLVYYLLINIHINKKYNWLNGMDGKITDEERYLLGKNIKALFLHKIGGVIVFGTDNLVISKFINLDTVSKFNSYNMIISAIQGIIGTAMTSITSSIGNLLTENDKEKTYKVHQRIFFINFWIVSLVCITLFNTLTQFIQLWLGKSQVLDNLTINIILINLYFQLMRGSVERFKDASGNYYQDRYSSVVESVINLVASVILVNKIGLPGVFIGTFLSNILVVFWVKPLITYKYVFNKSVIKYFIMYFKFLLISLLPLFMTRVFSRYLNKHININMFILNSIINIVIINIIYIIIFRKNKEFLYFKNLIIEKINNIIKCKERHID